MKALAAQLFPTPCDPMDCCPPGSLVHGILQAKILEWVALPLPGDLADLGIEPGSPELQADSLLSEPPGNHICMIIYQIKSNRFKLRFIYLNM